MKLIRIYFTKRDEASYISHLDLQRIMARALRRSGLPVWYSQGFNPHIYMSFALPLPLGHHSVCEMVDVKTESEQTDFSQYVQPLSEALPRGIEVREIAAPQRAAGEIAYADYTIRYEGEGVALAYAIEAYNKAQTAIVLRKTKRTEAEVDLKEYLPALEVCAQGESIDVRLPAGGSLSYNPELLCGFLRTACGLAAQPYVLRQGVFTADGMPFK